MRETRGDPNGIREEGQANRLLAEESEERPQHVVEDRNLSERRQCGPVRRVLPSAGGDVRQDAHGPRVLPVFAVPVLLVVPVFLVVLSHGCPSPLVRTKGRALRAIRLYAPLVGEISGRVGGAARAQGSAWPKSWIKSFTSSMPTESLTSPSVMPSASRTSCGTDAWVWSAGTLMRD